MTQETLEKEFVCKSCGKEFNERGELDVFHIFCYGCGEILCMHVWGPGFQATTCKCGWEMEESHDGRMVWRKHDARGYVVDGYAFPADEYDAKALKEGLKLREEHCVRRKRFQAQKRINESK